MHSDKKSPVWLKIVAFGGIAFLHFPIAVIIMYAFNTEESAFSFPLQGFTLRWFAAAFERPDIIDAIILSLKVATVATAIAMVLGTMAAAALYRKRFFGRETITLMFILPIALPGIITGIALLSAFRMAGWDLNYWTIVAGHATFCVVVIYNNVIARFRRTSQNLIEASMDLGADGVQTFFHIILPNIATALLAGGVLAFALSFDEIIVTTFTAGPERTLPIWLLNQLTRPRDVPITNVVAVMVMAATMVPILAAYYLTRGTESVEGSSK